MKKNNMIKMLGMLAVSFVFAGSLGLAANAASAENAGIVSISENKLYIDGVEITAEEANFKTSHKASVRYDATKVEVDGVEYEQTGMRFLSWINDDVFTPLMQSAEYTVSFGTIIVNDASINADESNFTKEDLPNTETQKLHLDIPAVNFIAENNEISEQENVTEFSAIIYGISEENYDKARMARAYMTVTNADKTQSVTIYADRTSEEGDARARSVADVAYRALKSSDYKLTAEEFQKNHEALCGYAKVHTEWKTYLNEAQEPVPYEYMAFIDTFEELDYFAPYENAYIELVDDIDLSVVEATDWTGDGATRPNRVVGILNADLNGNGHKMSGLTRPGNVDYETTNNIGFIGYLNGSVSNLWFEGSIGDTWDDNGTLKAYGSARARVGLFAFQNNGTIENCYIKGQIITGANNATQCNYLQSWGSVGMVFSNTGAIKNVMSDLIWTHTQNSKTLLAAVDPHLFAFAVSNTGKVDNCVTVNAQHTVLNSTSPSGTTSWIKHTSYSSSNFYSTIRTTSGFGVETRDGETYDIETGLYASGYAYTWGSLFTNGENDGVYLPGRNSYSWADKNRSNTYIFETYEKLLSGTGYQEKDNNTTYLIAGTSNEYKWPNVYNQPTGTEAQAALKTNSTAWSFENNTITLCGRVIYTYTAA